METEELLETSGFTPPSPEELGIKRTPPLTIGEQPRSSEPVEIVIDEQPGVVDVAKVEPAYVAPKKEEPQPDMRAELDRWRTQYENESRLRQDAESRANTAIQYGRVVHGRLAQTEQAFVQSQAWEREQTLKSLDAQLEHVERQMNAEGLTMAELTKLTRQMAKLETDKTILERAPKPVYNGPSVPTIEAQVQQPVPDTAAVQQKAAGWVQRNPWYKSDPALAAMAREIDQQIAKEGLSPNTDVFWQELDRRIESKRGLSSTAQPVATQQQQRKTSPVVPTSRISEAAVSGSRVTLTPELQTLAEQLWPQKPPKEAHRLYAEGVIKHRSRG